MDHDPDTEPEIEFSIVMPCLDEAATLEACVTSARKSLADNGIVGEIIVADNGSSDGSQQLAAALGARVVNVERRGYGNALMGGIKAARGRFVIMGDSDQSYDFGNLMPFVDKLREGSDLVMGNRFRGGVAPGAMPALHYYVGNPLLTAIGRLFFSSPCGDFHCGLRGFRREAVIAMDLRTTGMEFASEMIVKASLLGLRIDEVPTKLRPDGRDRAPHLRSWRDGWRHLRFLLLYSPRWLFLYPGAGLMGVGLVAGLWLLPAPRTVFGATLDVHTLMYAAAAVSIGFQSVVFAIFTKMFSASAGLIPADPRLARVARWFPLEAGLLVGSSMFALGLGGSVWALTEWGSRSFGPLDPSQTLRVVIPSTLALTLGLQIILSSFFLSVLRLSRRGPEAE